MGPRLRGDDKEKSGASMTPTTSLLDRANLDRDAVRHQVARGLTGADDGELFLEYSQTEALMFDNGRLKQATYDTSQGFGLRAVKDDGQERGSKGYGGGEGYARLTDTGAGREAADGAIREAVVNLESVPPPAGEMDVVLGAGWPGVMLHEAVGHGLEGDFNRKQTSAFAGLMGQQVAAKGVTVVDDGTMAARRGSLSIDDEGTPTNRTVLIEDGILVGYMQDRQNARLMNMKPTGNGRRQGYAHVPMPRMTNTYMLAGSRDPAEILASVKNGLYAANFGGGQVDITSGKYVFQCTEAYKIENGKVGAPLKGAMLIGNGPTDLHRITMIGNDLALDTGIGTCGKNGQGVPVGVGQPTLRMERITVGGTG